MGILYQKRRLKVNKIKRQIFSTRAILLKLRALLSFLMLVGICFLGIKILKLPQWYIDSEKLMKANSSVIKIQGNLITPEYKIINIIRQTQLPYTQIFRLDTKELEENLQQLQPIKKVYIRRFWFPARLVISIDERIPAFILAPNLQSEPNSALRTDGVLIDHDYLPLHPSIKAKKLLTYGVRNGLDEIWEKKKVENLLKLVRAIETYSGQQMQYIDIRNEKDVYIMLEKYLIRFGEINDTALTRAKTIAAILPEAEKYDKKLKYIDLRWDDSHYLRLQGEKEIKKEALNQTKPLLQKEDKENKEDKKQEKQKKEENKTEETMQEEILN